jgi:hypothetical protein
MNDKPGSSKFAFSRGSQLVCRYGAGSLIYAPHDADAYVRACSGDV